jgi:cytidyltransferase-like protein
MMRALARGSCSEVGVDRDERRTMKSRGHMDTETKIVSKTVLQRIRLEGQGKTIVFCSGCFDVFHAGHAVFINQCAALGDVLVVGVGRDSTVRTLKGPARPVNPERNRLYVVANLCAVNYALLTDELQANSDVKEILDALRPDIFAVTEDDAMAIEAEAGRCLRLGIRLITVPRTVPEGLSLSSTSEILRKSARVHPG